MSKKKASGGSTTMTLKDFHGGSIPSDLPLPSAPGVISRPSDRPGFDRQGAWGNPMGRSDRRLRPGSAGSVRNIDDKTPFLSPSANIGRNFDEDERKPLDGVSGPRRTVSDESVRSLPTLTEPKPDYSHTGALPGQQVLPPASHLSSSSGSSYAGRVTARFTEPANVGMNSPNLGANTGQAASGMHINTWAIREEAVSTTAPLPATWSGPNAASKLAQASALEKVSSGRWQSKQLIHHPTDVEVIRHTAIDSEFRSKDDTFYSKNSYRPVVVEDGVEYHGTMLAANAQRSLTVDVGIRVGGRELPLPTYERARSPIFPEAFESNQPSYVYGDQPACDDSKFRGSEFQSPVPSEHPKLKPLLRPKPLEILEPPVNHKMGYQKPHNSDHLDYVVESYASANPTKSGLSGSLSVNRTVERPKLNLKPRSQPIEHLEENVERERNSVFGGARPRELVLKERRTDDVAIINNDVSQPPRIKHFPRTETVSAHPTPTRYQEKAASGNTPVDNRIVKNNDMQDNRVEGERADIDRRNWRSDNRKNNRETEKERQPSPETWRKPVQQLKPVASVDASGGLHLAKAASAVELAEAFSRSISDQKTADRFPGQRGVPIQGPMLFSRLMGPTSRPHINGY